MEVTRPIDPAEAGFLAALRAEPGDETARLAYADWLADRGDPRAELLRLAVEERRTQTVPLPGSRSDILRHAYDRTWQHVAVGPLPAAQPHFQAHDWRTNCWVDRVNPGCVVLLVSRAGWLRSARAGETTVADQLATHINRVLGELVTMGEAWEEKPRPIYHVALIGYGTDRTGNPVVGPLFSGPLAGRELATLSDLYDHPLAIETRLRKWLEEADAGGFVERDYELRSTVWYRGGAGLWSASPMCAGLEYVRRLTERWAQEHADNFPPVVLHFTGGDSSDGDPAAAFARLKSVATRHNPLFLVNVLCGERHGEPTLFPVSSPTTGEEMRRLFEGASIVCDAFRERLASTGVPPAPGCRALVVNTDPTRLLRVLPYGSAPICAPATLPPHLR